MSLIGTTEVKKKLIGKVHLLREIPGFSAYELAVKHGFKGTEEEWLKSLSVKGDPGTLQSHTEVDALGHRVINVAEPTEDTDAVTKGYADSNYLKTDGSGTMTGHIKNVSNEFYAIEKERTVDDITYRMGVGLGAHGGYGSASLEIRSSEDNYSSMKNRIDVRADGKVTITQEGKTSYLFGGEDISNDFLAEPESDEKNFGWLVMAYKCGNVIHGQISASNVDIVSHDALFRINNKYRPISNPIFSVKNNDTTGYNLSYETSMIPFVTGDTSEILVCCSANYKKAGTLIIDFMYMCE